MLHYIHYDEVFIQSMGTIYGKNHQNSLTAINLMHPKGVFTGVIETNMLDNPHYVSRFHIVTKPIKITSNYIGLMETEVCQNNENLYSLSKRLYRKIGVSERKARLLIFHAAKEGITNESKIIERCLVLKTIL